MSLKSHGGVMVSPTITVSRPCFNVPYPLSSEWQTMYDLAKMFLHCLNHWRLETPALRKASPKTEKNEDGAVDRAPLHTPPDDVTTYKVCS